MKKTLTLFLLTFIFISSCKEGIKYNEALNPYVDFLKGEQRSAKDYVLNLFQNKDIVILTERDHRELTQYDLILDIVSDNYFRENIKDIYVETGMRNLNPELNEFINSEGLSEKEIEEKLIYFQRKCSHHPIWSFYNYNYFIKGLYKLNQNQPKSKKINIYPTDVAIDWETADSAKYASFIKEKVVRRDSFMADFISKKLETTSNSKKALVIMNYRHAFNDKFKSPDGSDFDNVGHYLFTKHTNKVANVLINTLVDDNASDNISTVAPIHKGKWDASFKVLNKTDIGFNFKNNPFGKDHFDYWAFFKHDYKYEDVFTGYIYYEEPKNFKLVTGVPNLIDSTFIEKYKNKERIFKKAWKRKQKESSDEEIYKMNETKEFNYAEIENINKSIKSWL